MTLYLMKYLINTDESTLSIVIQTIIIIRKLVICDSRKVVIFEPGEQND